MMSAEAQSPSTEEKFDNLLIDIARVNKLIGRRSPGEVRFEESEQSDARRELLHVEKIAIRSKEVMAMSEANFIDSLSQHLHHTILDEFSRMTSHAGDVYKQVLNLTDDVTDMIDALATKACSVKKLEPIAAGMPWLYDELIKILNSPKHRRRDSKGRIVVVETLRTALSFMGIDNLKLLFPALVLKRTLPTITDPYPQIKQRTWQYGLACALSARELAKFSNVKPYDAYVMAMISVVGRNIVGRAYFKLFDHTHKAQLLSAQEQKYPDLHEGLLKVLPSANYLTAMQNEYADKLAADMFEHMVFKRLAITEPMRQLADFPILDTEDGLARVVYQARTYAQFRMLWEQKVISKEEAKRMLGPCDFPTGSLDILQKLDLRQLPLEVDVD